MYMIFSRKTLLLIATVFGACSFKQLHDPNWQSAFIKINSNGSIAYSPDEKGNTIPDFSHTGYYQGNQSIPDIAVVKTLSPADGSSEKIIQDAIDELSKNSYRKG